MESCAARHTCCSTWATCMQTWKRTTVPGTHIKRPAKPARGWMITSCYSMLTWQNPHLPGGKGNFHVPMSIYCQPGEWLKKVILASRIVYGRWEPGVYLWLKP